MFSKMRQSCFIELTPGSRYRAGMPLKQLPASWPLIDRALRTDGAPERFVAAVERRVSLIHTGELGTMAEATIEPIASLPPIDETAAVIGRAAIDRMVVIKLNGGLATSMGLDQPKSLLGVRGKRTFLDLVIYQLAELPKPPPLILFNSFATQAATQAALAQRQPSASEIQTIVQHRLPKLDATTLAPVSWPADPVKAWCPPGHGDLYLALATSGLLKQLLERGIEYAFVSNIDNLGATLDPALLGMLERDRIPFLMEVAERTPTDTKGGHLALADGHRLTLRELAQCPVDDRPQFQDIARHRFFNTNSLWLHLPSIAALLDVGDALVDLPLIVNRKTVDPADPTSPPVVQLETAMGSAISAISGARAIHVPRHRFAPVKTTNELLIVRSDAYELTAAGELTLTTGRVRPPHVALGPTYQLLADFERRLPYGAPSLRDCDELIVEGDVTFGATVTIRGSVHLTENQRIPDGTVLEG